MADFSFIDRYRDLQPGALREVITARQAAFNEIIQAASKSESALNLVRIAFGLAHPPGSTAETWFSSILKSKDEFFSIEHDREEAARIASLALSYRISQGSFGSPLAVLAAFFGGHGQAPQAIKLAAEAKQGLASLVRKRGNDPEPPDIKIPTAANLADAITKFDADTATSIKEVVDAIAKDYSAQIKDVVTATTTAHTALRAENRRLAEEVDLLWWHLGGHSFLLDQPLVTFDPAVLPIIVGMDVACMVNQLPGPYGTYGIIRRALGETADVKVKLSDIVKHVDASQHAGLMSAAVKDTAIAPIHAIVGEIALNQTPMTEAVFKARTNLSFDLEATNYDFALQAYHERLLIQHDWLK